ncbi:aspartate/glutamate racemase family protein [Paracoccus pacificus]|uniref:Aspartate/glutamate racemase family protein n=1 Tax=Paracoccus pacificus TaxID=1463598 RepID=A0ABW4RAV1_9RHOB
MGGFIGILGLDTRFPRILGDAGNPASYHLPARLRVIDGAGSPQIVRDGLPDPALVARFVTAAQTFEAEGAALITSTCGFLVSAQDRIAGAVRIPVLLSALSLGPVIRGLTGNRPLGILTASAASLGPQALTAAGLMASEVRIAGLEREAAFAGLFLAAKEKQAQSIDPAEIEALVVAAGQKLIAEAPDIGAVLLECGNLPPYADALRRAIGRPVFSILDGARMLAP